MEDTLQMRGNVNVNEKIKYPMEAFAIAMILFCYCMS